jgi:hypothetical protein
MWFPVGPSRPPVSMRVQRIGSSTVPGVYKYVPVESSIKQTLLQSSFSSVPALHFRALRLPTWVFALSLTSPHCFHSCEASTASLASSSAFSAVRQLCNVACELVSSHSQVQDYFLVQGLVHFVQPSAFIRLVTPMPLSIRTLTCKQVATYERLDSDVLLHTKAASHRFGV